MLSTPSAPAPAATSDAFGDDPFGADPFGGPSPAAPPAPAVQIKIAPPLNPLQIQQHRKWLLSAIATSGGLIYDDGTLQVTVKIELRGSQCRFTFLYNNQSPGNLTDFKVIVNDVGGLIRYELPTFQNTLSGLGKYM